MLRVRVCECGCGCGCGCGCVGTNMCVCSQIYHPLSSQERCGCRCVSLYRSCLKCQLFSQTTIINRALALC